jgi:hypothetical protein
LSEARAERTPDGNLRASKIVDGIKKNYPFLNNDEKIDLLVKNKIHGPNEATEYFGKNADDLNDLLMGKVGTASQYNEGMISSRLARVRSNSVVNHVNNFISGESTAQDLQKTIDEVMSLSEGNIAGFDSFTVKANRTFLNKLQTQMEIAPTLDPIEYGDHAVKSLKNIYSLSRITGFPKDISKALTESYLNSDLDKRMLILRGLYSGIMIKMGLHTVDGGVERMNQILNDSFGHIGTFASTSNLEKPMVAFNVKSALNDFLNESGDDLARIVKGPVQFNQLDQKIAPLPFDKIAMFVADQRFKTKNPLSFIRALGGLTNTTVSNQVLKNWKLFTLLPSLGMRTILDEGFFAGLTLPGHLVFDYLRGKGFRYNNLFAALNRSDKTIPPIRGLFLSKIGKNPSEFITDADKESLWAEANAFAGGDAKNAKDLYTKMYFNHVWNVYGKRLAEDEKQYLFDMWLHEPRFLDNAASTFTRSYGFDSNLSNILPDEFFTPSELDKAYQRMGYEQGGKFKSVDIANLATTKSPMDVTFAHFAEFVKRFSASNRLKLVDETGKEVTLDPVNAFIRNKGLETEADYAKASDELMATAGLKRENGQLTVCNRSRVLGFLKNFSTNGHLLQQIGLMAGVPAADVLTKELAQYSDHALSLITEKRIHDSLNDLRHIFHGGANNFNGNLLKHVVESSGGSVGLNSIGSVESFALGQKPLSQAIDNLDLDTFDTLVQNHRIRGSINTPIDFGPDKSFLEKWTRGGNKAFELTDRQVNSAVRSPVITMLALKNRKASAEAEALFKKQLMDDGLSETAAENVASKRFTHLSVSHGIDEAMQFMDNPNVRTHFSNSMNVLGGFYRATEDFIRRAARLYAKKPATSLYRMRLMHQGLQTSGFLYKDDNGDEYIGFPGDQVIFAATDNASRAIFGQPLSQPVVNNLTFKISNIFPSLQQNAAAPTFGGPVAGLATLVAKGLLGQFGTSGKIAGNKLDGLVLGSFGDNLTLTNAIVPSKLKNLFALLPGQDHILNINSATQKALCYLTANNMLKDSKGNPLTAKSSSADKVNALKQVRITVHNELVLKDILGIIVASPTLRDSVDVPDYLKKNGTVSLSNEYYNLYEYVSKKYGDTVQDPWELALVMFTKKYPNRAVYTISKSEKTSRVAVAQIKGMDSWLIKNKSLLDTYSDAAMVFAPRIGEYSPGLSTFLKINGFTTATTEKYLDTYLDKALTIADKNRFYALSNYADQQMAKTASTNERKQIQAQVRAAQGALLAGNPLLASMLGPSNNQPGSSDEQILFNNIKEILAKNPESIDAKTKKNMAYAVKIMDDALPQLQDPNLKAMGSNGTLMRADIKANAMFALRNISAMDPSVAEASRTVFEPLLNYYQRDVNRTTGVK